MIDETTNMKLRAETMAYLQRADPAYAALVDRYWTLVLEIFVMTEIERFHNFVFPASRHGIALRLTLETLAVRS